MISVLVDSFTITGERITIDAGIVNYTKPDNTTVQVVVPYIGYFNGTSRLPTNYYDKKSTDNVHGTTNPILGYAIESTTGTCFETAQMK